MIGWHHRLHGHEFESALGVGDGQEFFISWLQSLSAVVLESKKIKSVTVSIVSPSICHEVMGPDLPLEKFV